MGFYTRVAGPATLSEGCWVGFRFLNLVLFALLAVLAALLATASAASASTTPSTCEPQVNELGAMPFWDNYNDYLDRRLTIEESLERTGGCVPCLMRIAQVESGNGVSLETKLPIDLGEMQPASTATVRMKFLVPQGVSRFHSRARFVCEQPAPSPVTGSQLTIEPGFAWANEGCPVLPPEELAGQELPSDLAYGSRLFTATLTDENGDPVPGKIVKWHLSNNISFRILDSTGVTDENGRVTAMVTPPQYFICVAPYFDRGATKVTAISEDLLAANATFVYSRCAPPTF